MVVLFKKKIFVRSYCIRECCFMLALRYTYDHYLLIFTLSWLFNRHIHNCSMMLLTYNSYLLILYYRLYMLCYTISNIVYILYYIILYHNYTISYYIILYYIILYYIILYYIISYYIILYYIIIMLGRKGHFRKYKTEYSKYSIE